MQLSYEVMRSDSTTRVWLRGEIDLGVADQALDVITKAVFDGDPPRVIVDLSEVTLLDSTGIGALIAARQVALRRSCSFAVENPKGMVARVLSVTGVLETLTDATVPEPRAAAD